MHEITNQSDHQSDKVVIRVRRVETFVTELQEEILSFQVILIFLQVI